jgi:hypothetical protein
VGIDQQPLWRPAVPKRVRYFTVLRDPVARSVSEYHYLDRPYDDFMLFFRLSGRAHSPWRPSDAPMCQQLCCFWSEETRKRWLTGRTLTHCAADEKTLKCAKVRTLS